MQIGEEASKLGEMCEALERRGAHFRCLMLQPTRTNHMFRPSLEPYAKTDCRLSKKTLEIATGGGFLLVCHLPGLKSTISFLDVVVAL